MFDVLALVHDHVGEWPPVWDRVLLVAWFIFWTLSGASFQSTHSVTPRYSVLQCPHTWAAHSSMTFGPMDCPLRSIARSASSGETNVTWGVTPAGHPVTHFLVSIQKHKKRYHGVDPLSSCLFVLLSGFKNDIHHSETLEFSGFSFFQSEFSISPFKTRHLVIEELALSLCCVINTGNPVLSKSMTNLGSIWTPTKYHSDSKKYAKLFVKNSNQNGFRLILIRQNFIGFAPDFTGFFLPVWWLPCNRLSGPIRRNHSQKIGSFTKLNTKPHFETFTGRWMQIEKYQMNYGSPLPCLFGLKLIKILNTN